MDGEKNQKGKREILDKDVDEKKKCLFVMVSSRYI
jgi:hypothetical protein